MVEKSYRQYADLDEALEQKHIPLENRPIIRALIATIECSRFEETTGYIKVTRSQPGPTTEIGWGWVTGYLTREDADGAGGVSVWPYGHGWGITLPINKGRDGGDRGRPPITSGKVCPTHHLEALGYVREYY